MVKDLSRDKFGAVNCYSGKLSARWLAVTPIFTYTADFRFYPIIFPGNTWRTFRASRIFGFKNCWYPGYKNTDRDGPGWISENSESSAEQVSESKFEFPLYQKNTMFAQITWCVSERFLMFFWNPAITTDRKVLFFWCFSERKALFRPLMINKILCQLKLRNWLSYRRQQNTLANYHVKCHGRFLGSFLRIHGYLTREIYVGIVFVTHTNTISYGKRVSTTVGKMFRVWSHLIIRLKKAQYISPHFWQVRKQARLTYFRKIEISSFPSPTPSGVLLFVPSVSPWSLWITYCMDHS